MDNNKTDWSRLIPSLKKVFLYERSTLLCDEDINNITETLTKIDRDKIIEWTNKNILNKNKKKAISNQDCNFNNIHIVNSLHTVVFTNRIHFMYVYTDSEKSFTGKDPEVIHLDEDTNDSDDIMDIVSNNNNSNNNVINKTKYSTIERDLEDYESIKYKLFDRKTYDSYIQQNGKPKTFNFTNILALLDLNANSLDKSDIIILPVFGPLLTSETNSVLLENHMPIDRGSEHWSLLCYSKSEKKIFYYDTLSRLNYRRAQEVFMYLTYFGIIPKETSFIEPEFIQFQGNGWECGFFVIIYTFIIITKHPCRPVSDIDINDRYSKYLQTYQGRRTLIRKIIKLIKDLFVLPNQKFI
jgi:hypothetical protein